MAESPPPQGASGGPASDHGLVDLSPALPNFVLPVIESPSAQVESSLPRPPSCQVNTTAGGDAGAQASDETSPTKERSSQRRLFDSVDQQINTSPSNVQPPDQVMSAFSPEQRDELAGIGLTEEGVMARMNEAGVESVEDFKMLCLKEFMSKQERATATDDDLTTIKAKTMYRMIEDVHDPEVGINRKLLFLSSKQCCLIAQDPSAISKMLDAFLIDKQQPKLVINLLPSMIRSWMRVRPLPGDPDGEREGIAALDRFMAEQIIPLAQRTHAIILCSALQPFCVLSESLSQASLPFTIISYMGHVPHLYKNQREGSTWKAIRKLSKVWQERKMKDPLSEGRMEQDKLWDNIDFDMDLDPNGTNFIMVDPIIREGTMYCVIG